MFPINETVLGAEVAYRRERLLAARPVRRERAQRQAVAASVASRVAAKGTPCACAA